MARCLLSLLAVVPLATGILASPAQASPGARPAAATVGLPASTKVCGEQRSNRMDFWVRNYLSVPVTLRVGQVNCSDWSNTGNPTNANGVQVAPSGKYGWGLELARRTKGEWRLFVDAGPGVGKGSVDVTLWLGGVQMGFPGADLRLIGPDREKINREYCYAKRIAPTSEPASIPPVRTDNDLQRSSLQIYSDGSHIVVRACSDVSRSLT